MAEQDPSTQLRKQRIRNRIIEYLETAASADLQREYERLVPIANVPNEMIEMWSDVVSPARWEWYDEPVLTRAEHEAMRTFHEIWRTVAAEMPEPLDYSIEALIDTALWDRLMRAAAAAEQVFALRGRLSDVAEETFPV